MLYRYNKKLIADYVYGNDIDDYSTDELEDTSEFMYDVMVYSKDKNFYDLCSDNVKSNYDFIKKIIILFKDDLKFIDKVAKEYFNRFPDQTRSEFEDFELNILVSSFMPKNLNTEYSSYAISAAATYEVLAVELAGALDQVEDKKYLKILGKGFILVKDRYGNSPIILDYVAKRFISEIFSNEDISFEEYVHTMYKEKAIIEEIGIRRIIINIIYYYDTNLADYVQAHIDTISLIEEKYKMVLKNWDNYLSRVNKQKILVLYQETFDYIADSKLAASYTVKELIDYVASTLNLSDIIEKYDEPDLPEFADMKKAVDSSLLTIHDVKLISYLTELMKELFKDDSLPKYKEKKEQNNKSDNMARIIKFDPNKKES